MVATAIVGSAVVGAVASNSASKKAASASNNATAAASAAADRQADLAERQYNDYLTYFQPKLLSEMDRSGRIADAAEARTAQQFAFDRDQSQRYADRYWGVQTPLEDRIIDRASEYDTDAFRESMVNRGLADYRIQSDLNDDIMRRGLQRRSVTMNSGQALAFENQNALRRASESAGMANMTRERAREIASAKLNEAAALGRGLPGFQSTSSQLSLGWNNAGVAAGQAGMNSVVAGSGANNAAYTTGSNLWGASASTGLAGLQGYNQSLATAYRDPFNSVMGSIAGLGTGYAGMKLGIPMGT